MRPMTYQGYLSDRKVVSVSGPDTHDFLQRVITTDMALVEPGRILPGALLTPQGKIICDFLIHGSTDGVFIDIAGDAAEKLVGRLTLYRLRAKAEIVLRQDVGVVVGSGQSDPRSDDLPDRKIKPHDGLPDLSKDQAMAEIKAGIPAFARDYGEAEVFPTDVNLDLYSGIGWKKGCFIGQEVLSRMKRRGTIRKRSILLTFEELAPEKGSAVMAGETPIGEITSSAGHFAVARIRTDRLSGATEPLFSQGWVARPGPVPE